MNIVVNGGAETRATNGAWENTDQFGMGWYLYQKTPDDGVEASQDKSIWEAAGWDNKNLNNNLYANHKFTYNSTNSSFVASSDVYQGAYFLYYPFASQSSATGIKAKAIEVNAVNQTGDFEYERFNQALHISAQDFIEADDVTEAGQTLTKEFVLSPAVNVFGVKATAEAGITGESDNVTFFKNMSIMDMAIDAGGDNHKVFASKATLQPLYIPHVVRTVTGDIDVAKTVEALDEAAALSLQGVAYPEPGARSYLDKTTADMTNLLTTTVRNDYTIANAGTDENRIRAFAFPIEDVVTYATDEAPAVKVRVGKWNAEPTVHNTYELGEFAIAGDENKTFNENLVKAFTEDGLLNTIIRKDGEWSYVNLDATLLLSHFTPLTDNIMSVEQWKDLVKVYDALYEMGAINPEAAGFVKPVFTIGTDLTFTDEIPTPKNIDIVLHTVDADNNVNKLFVDGEEVTWPSNLITDNMAEIVVNEGTTLNVGMDGELTELFAIIDNNGVINAGAKTQLNKSTEMPIRNNGRIVIKYGAYVYPNVAQGGVEGIIAYRLEESNEVAKINKLMLPTAAAANKGIASINTLIIPEGITLDLDAKITEAGDENDRYEADDQTMNTPLENLDDITIELEGGTIENGDCGTTANAHNFVKAVIAVEGETSKMVDVQTTDITVKAGTLTIDAKSHPITGKCALNGVKNITNNANLDVLTNVDVENIENYGHIDVEAPYKMTYESLNQTNPATGDKGNFSGNVVQDEPEVVYDTLTQAVVTAWENGLQGNLTTYSETVQNFKLYGNDSDSAQAAFITALNAWRQDKMITTDVTYNTISENDLKQFEAISGYKLGLTD